jgi:O-antigen/teichoic acid export membrane protein
LGLVVVWHLALILRQIWTELKETTASFAFREWTDTSSGLALIALISSADLYLYTIILGGLLPGEAVGAFFASLKTVELINLFLMAVTLIVSMDISRLVAAGKIEELQNRCNMAILLQAIPAVAASLFIIALAPMLLGFFAPEYVSYSGLLRLLVLGMLVNALTGATVLMMQVGGMHWRQLLYQGGGIGLSAILLPFLVSSYGVTGAALAFLIYKVGWNILAVLAIRKRLGVDPSLTGLFFRNKIGFFPLLKEILVSARK